MQEATVPRMYRATTEVWMTRKCHSSIAQVRGKEQYYIFLHQFHIASILI